MSNVDTFLAHYGVKGMKWGVRKKRAGLGIREDVKNIAIDTKKTQREQFRALRDNDNLNVRGKAINLTNRLTMGKKFTTKYYNAQIRQLDKEIDRIEGGRATFRDKVDAVIDSFAHDPVPVTKN